MILVVKYYKFSLLLSLFLFFISCKATSSKEYETVIEGPTMGTSYKVVIKSMKEINTQIIRNQLDSILNVINQSMSTYIDNSEISIFNKAKKDSPIKISDHFHHVLKKSFYYNEISGKLFDITISPLYELWGFRGNDDSYEPTKFQISQAMTLIGMNQIILKNQEIYKTDNQVSIDVNAIAKGYGVDVISNHLSSLGYFNHFVDGYIW